MRRLSSRVKRAWHALASVLAVGVFCPAAPAPADLPPPLPQDQQAADALLRIAGDTFRIRQSDHFMIAYDTSPTAVTSLVGRLEGTFDAIWKFCEGLALPIRPPTKKLQVLFFDREEGFVRFCSSVGFSAGSMAGIYHDGVNLAAFSNTLNNSELRQITRAIEQAQARLKQLSKNRPSSPAARQRRQSLRREHSALRAQRDAIVKRFNRLVIQHEAAHQMLFNIGLHVPGAVNPTWLVEGLACQFEVPQTRAGRGLRRINHMRLADLRDLMRLAPRDKRISDEAYHRALTAERLIPIADLVGERSMVSHSNTDLNDVYAQAWALVYYLQREHRDGFAAYLRRLSSRKPGEPVGRQRELDDFEASLGPLSTEFQHGWIAHMVRLRLDREEAGR